MAKKTISRRDFLKTASAATGATLFVSIAPQIIKAAPPAQEEVTLDFVSWLPEYDNAYRQIWDIFEAQHPGIKINVTAINEDTRAAFDARVAGGYLPAMKQLWHDEPITSDNYTNFVDLSTIDFPWFDRWLWDVENEWSNRYGISGPRCLDPYAGIVASPVYHVDIVEKTGWDPQKDIKTMDDLRAFAEDLTRYVETDPDVDFGWDRAWLNGFTYLRLMNLVPVAFPDGGRDRQYACWMGEAKFDDPDSPYRHTLEWLNEAYEKGWNPENWWNREWEADMEASFIAKKSALVTHGHWMWDKTLAGNPDAQLAGFPFPSVDGEQTILHMEEPFVDSGWTMFAPVQELPEWEQIKTAFNWWNSPDAVYMRALAEGRAVLYEVDQELELDSAQWNGLIKHVGKGDWEHVVMDTGPWGEQAAAPYRKPGSPGVWDRETGGFNETFVAAVRGDITALEAMEIAQANWDESYEGLPR